MTMNMIDGNVSIMKFVFNCLVYFDNRLELIDCPGDYNESENYVTCVVYIYIFDAIIKCHVG